MQQEKQLKQRIFGLDLIRAIAIIFVLISHLHYVIDSYNPTFIAISGVLGYFGVELFFVLSGFLIGTILLKLYLESNFTFRQIKRFLKRRWYRTLPAYYLTLVLNIILAFMFNYEYNNWLQYVFFVQNFSTYSIQFFMESWSLSVEEWTYLLLPLILYLGVKLLKMSKKASFLFTVLTLIGIIHLIRFYAYLNLEIFNINNWNTALKSVVIYRLDAILFGVILAWVYWFYKEWLFKNRIYACVIAIHLFIMQFLVLNFMGFSLVTHPLYFKVFYFTLTAITISLAMPFFVFWKKEKQFIQLPIELVSKISYSIYLLHYGLIAVLFKYVVATFELNLNSAQKILIYLISTFCLSYLMYRYYEKPITRLRDKK